MVQTIDSLQYRNVLNTIARTGLNIGDHEFDRHNNSNRVNLYGHQKEAVERIENIISQWGGALLADATGLGKTLTALSTAIKYTNIAIVAPANLLNMWKDKADLFTWKKAPEFISIHSFSKKTYLPFNVHNCKRLVIIDEAHHLRNRRTYRFTNLSSFCSLSHVLLISATPIYNRRRDLLNLFSLFLGNRSFKLKANEIPELIVRRDISDARISLPKLISHPPHRIEASPDIVDLISKTNNPYHQFTNGLSHTLLIYSMLHAWGSSASALIATTKNRILRATIARDLIKRRISPNISDLRSLAVGNDSIQLDFSIDQLSDGNVERTGKIDWPACENDIDQYINHLQIIYRKTKLAENDIDGQRAGFLVQLLKKYPNASMLVFTRYTETVASMRKFLSGVPHIAWLTSSGGHISSGSIDRSDILKRFSPISCGLEVPHTREKIRMLISTDILAEGINLQDAEIVVHMDLPWSHSALLQRIGRIRRIGSFQKTIHSFTMDVDSTGKDLIKAKERIIRKSQLSIDTLNPNSLANKDLFDITASPLHKVFRSWLLEHADNSSSPICVISGRSALWVASVSNMTSSISRYLLGGIFKGRSYSTSASPDEKYLLKYVQEIANISPTNKLYNNNLSISRYIKNIEHAIETHIDSQCSKLLTKAVSGPLERALSLIRNSIVEAGIQRRGALISLSNRTSQLIRNLHGIGAELHIESLISSKKDFQSTEAWLEHVSLSISSMYPDVLEAKPQPYAADSFNSYSINAILIVVPG